MATMLDLKRWWLEYLKDDEGLCDKDDKNRYLSCNDQLHRLIEIRKYLWT